MGYTPYHQPISKSVNLDVRVNRQLESRMREIRQSGSEGGGAQTNAFSLPLSGTAFAVVNEFRKILTSIFVIRMFVCSIVHPESRHSRPPNLILPVRGVSPEGSCGNLRLPWVSKSLLSLPLFHLGECQRNCRSIWHQDLQDQCCSRHP